ncbi:IS66 family insertion sequence element accessory protein TnpB [Acinetobacter baumannii]
MRSGCLPSRWTCVQGMDTAMAQVPRAFGYIKPHCAYLFCNKRGHRMKVLVHDGLGIWLCARRLEQGKFHWAKVHQGEKYGDQPGAVTGTDPGFALGKESDCSKW